MKNTQLTAEELQTAARTLRAVETCIRRELATVRRRKGQILDERKYFMDYFAELKDDEKKDLMGIEEVDTQNYLRSVEYLARLAKQQKEPYFAGFTFCPSDDPEDPIRCRLSIQTLRDPETGEILTYDWRAPIASLYYECEPGQASFDTPDGKVEGLLLCKMRCQFHNGQLQKCTEISMPSDDEMLAEALRRNAGEHMRTILQTLQASQHRIVREHIEGITVIAGCAGSGKTSVALHKAAYILYGFRERMKHAGLAIIAPNDVFSEYISTVLPDLGEQNIRSLLPDDVVTECMSGFEETFAFRSRMEEAEQIEAADLSGDTGRAEAADRARAADPAEALCGDTMRICREHKSGEDFRLLILAYATYLRGRIFTAEDMYLTAQMEGSVSTQELHELFYGLFDQTPLLARTREMTRYLCSRYDIRIAENKEFIQQSLDGMMRAVSAPALYRLMYRDADFQASHPADYETLSLYTDLFEDACAVALLNMLAAEPDLPADVFYLLCDEAQDFSPIFLELLRQRYRGCDMLFLGDADQVVFENSGNFRDDIKRILPRRPFRYYELHTNYRSTKEIVAYAANILGRDPETYQSVRSGAAPEEITLESEDDATVSEQVLRILRGMQERGLESAAILTRTDAQAKRLRTAVRIPQTLASGMRVHFMPVYLAKGLEFDGVIVWHAQDACYRTEKGRFMLYTACTRAMHELAVIR